jgi:hypothetical protein
MKGISEKIFALKSVSIEDAITQTLDRRFRSEIPVIVPDCYVDLLSRKVGGQESNLIAFTETKTNEVAILEAGEVVPAIMRAGVKTLGILDPHCQFKMFVNDSADGIKKDIKGYSQSYQTQMRTSSEDGNVNISIDSFIFQGAGKKYYGYTNFFPPYPKKQIESRFEPFLKNGGAIVSLQDRYAPITHFASQNLAVDKEFSTLFCEISDSEIHAWTAVNCGDDIFCPLVADYVNKLLLTSCISLLDSVIGQTTKQYHFWAPNRAVLLDVRETDTPELEAAAVVKSLQESCGQVILLEEKSASQNAGLHGAILLALENRPKKKNEKSESEPRDKMPRVNVTSMEWTHNYLIPLTLKEFYRKGIFFLVCLTLFIFLCWGAYWFVGNFRSAFEHEINGLQGSTAKTLREFAVLKERSEEFSQLGNWRLLPDIATQYSALSSFLMRNNCLLVRAVFHSKVQDLTPKMLEDIRPEAERLTKSAIGALDIAGIWELSFRLPIMGVSTTETRKNIVAALQKDAASAFSAGPRDTASPKSLLVLNGEQGQNTMNMLRNENGMNAVFLVWNAPAPAGRR